MHKHVGEMSVHLPHQRHRQPALVGPSPPTIEPWLRFLTTTTRWVSLTCVPRAEHRAAPAPFRGPRFGTARKLEKERKRGNEGIYSALCVCILCELYTSKFVSCFYSSPANILVTLRRDVTNNSKTRGPIDLFTQCVLPFLRVYRAPQGSSASDPQRS